MSSSISSSIRSEKHLLRIKLFIYLCQHCHALKQARNAKCGENKMEIICTKFSRNVTSMTLKWLHCIWGQNIFEKATFFFLTLAPDCQYYWSYSSQLHQVSWSCVRDVAEVTDSFRCCSSTYSIWQIKYILHNNIFSHLKRGNKNTIV